MSCLLCFGETDILLTQSWSRRGNQSMIHACKLQLPRSCPRQQRWQQATVWALDGNCNVNTHRTQPPPHILLWQSSNVCHTNISHWLVYLDQVTCVWDNTQYIAMLNKGTYQCRSHMCTNEVFFGVSFLSSSSLAIHYSAITVHKGGCHIGLWGWQCLAIPWKRGIWIEH